MSSKWTIPLAIAAAGIIIALAVYVVVPKQAGMERGNPALVRPIGAADHILGSPAAKVVIIEYADFDCTYCVGFAETMRQIVANEGTRGSVAWIYRNFPLYEIHPNAMKHAEAAECVAATAGNDAYWKFVDLLYAHQPVDPGQYGTFAGALGIPGEAFANCYTNASSTVADRILQDRQNAFDIGARGTPYSLLLVTGKPPIVMEGAYPYDAVKALVDQALAD